MADRTSAVLFGKIFDILAADQYEELARKLWDLKSSYDFSSYQMNCDESLIKLGLARKDIDPEGRYTIRYVDREAKYFEDP